MRQQLVHMIKDTLLEKSLKPQIHDFMFYIYIYINSITFIIVVKKSIYDTTKKCFEIIYIN